MEASRWDRLQDFAQRLDRYERRLGALEDDVELLGRIDERLKGVEHTVGECHVGLRTLELTVREDRDKQTAEARTGRRFIIMAVIGASGATVAAIALIIALLQGPTT